MLGERRGWVVGLAWLVIATVPVVVRAQPEMPGPHEVDMWDAGSVPAGGMNVGAMVYYPKGVAGPVSPVAVIHGAGLFAAAYVDFGRTLASHGLVAVVLSFPDLLLNPTTAHGAAVNAVLDWVVMQAAGGMAPIPQLKNDARGIAGHSNGGQTTYYAAQQSNLYKSIVSLDAFGDLSGGGAFSGPSMHLLAETNGCSAGASGFMVAPPPKLLATVTGGSHCDVNDAAVAGACGLVCSGAPYNAGAHDIFRRYAVAFLVCLLGSEGSMMQPYVGGASWQADVTANRIHAQQESAAASITCNPDALLPMAGAGGAGAAGMGAAGATATGGAGGAAGMEICGCGGACTSGNYPPASQCPDPSTDTGTCPPENPGCWEGHPSDGTGGVPVAGAAPAAGAQAMATKGDGGGCAIAARGGRDGGARGAPALVAALALALVLSRRRASLRAP